MNHDKKPFGANEQAENELKDLYSETSDADNKSHSTLGNETTSAELDANIFAMAQEAVDSKTSTDSGSEQPPRPWLQRMKYPVSVAAALVMTVGITRLMVQLSEQPTSAAQMIEDVSAEQVMSKEVARTEVTLSSDNMMDKRVAQHEHTQAKQQDILRLEQQRLSRQKAESEAYAKRLKKESEQRRVELSHEQKIMAEQAAEAEVKLAEFDSVDVADGLEDIVESGVESGIEVIASPITRPVAKKSSVESSEVISITTSRVASSQQEIDTEMTADHYGVLDEAVRGYPLPEVWVEMIEKALNEEDEISALDEWGQFKRTYPDYKVSKKLADRIKSLQKIGENQ